MNNWSIVKSKFWIRGFKNFLGMQPTAVACYPFIFINPETELTEQQLCVLINHERIHLQQQKGIINFTFLYLVFV